MIDIPQYNIVYFLPLQSVLAADITGVFSELGDSFDRPIRMIRVKNYTDKDILISFDGSTDHLYLKSGESENWDFMTNTIPTYRFYQSQQTQVWLKYVSAPSLGAVYFEAVGNLQ